jgi:hypothetical protein
MNDNKHQQCQDSYQGFMHPVWTDRSNKGTKEDRGRKARGLRRKEPEK